LSTNLSFLSILFHKEGNMDSQINLLGNMDHWPSPEQTIRPADLILDHRAKCAYMSGRRIRLTKLEFGVLSYLTIRAGCVVSLDELLGQVWNTPTTAGGTTAQVKNCIRRLRMKIEPIPSQPVYIVTVFGHGYLMPIHE
jgi:DNA-binding response OmpR family regulator